MFLFDWINPLVWIRLLLAYFGFKKKTKLLIIGLDNAGKTTLVIWMSRGTRVQHYPTPIGSLLCRMVVVDFLPLQQGSEEPNMEELGFTAYEFSRHPPQVRRVRKHYFSAVDGVIFMVDIADHKRFDEAGVELDSLLKDDMLPDVPIAVLFNKTDLKDAVSEEYLSERLHLGIHRTGKKYTPVSELPSRPVETFPCSILRRQGYGDAMRWLAYYIE